MASDLISDTTDAAFESEVLNSDTPVLVDFWATWCGPCRALAPYLETIANDYKGRLKVVKLDIDHNQDTPTKYGVRGIPTLLIFKGGKEVDKLVGNPGSPKKIDDWVKPHVGEAAAAN